MNEVEMTVEQARALYKLKRIAPRINYIMAFGTDEQKKELREILRKHDITIGKEEEKTE